MYCSSMHCAIALCDCW